MINLTLTIISILRLVSAVAVDTTGTIVPGTGTDIDINLDLDPANVTEAGTDTEARMWGGFLNGCRATTFYLSNEDMNRPEGPDTFKPYIKSPMIGARCRDLSGREGCSSISLGECVGNNGGILTPWDQGGFSSSCFWCSLKGDSTLSCRCYVDRAKSGLTYNSELDLNDFVHNFNGLLKCHHSSGETGYCGPNTSYNPGKE
ncbi:hypothetical protein N3K66_004044 [Trichothecium roseum]|uniref:Uncharacterized protein n=1 Tax=Trichothecium roseum TaxID=47278 RepID=A0ACC0V9U4_9HYPO|nr:hypothetical protein N3K66_004044 [Trichothecium roseum]